MSSASACSMTSPASSRTPTAWVRWKPRGWRRKISTAAARASRSRSSTPITRTRPTWVLRSCANGSMSTASMPWSTCRIRPSASPSIRCCAISRMTFLASSTASSDLTGKACSPNTIQWVNDAWATGNSTAAAMMARGGKEWYFITVNFALGQGIEAEATNYIEKHGGKVLGSAKHPLNTADFASLSAAGAELQGQGDRPCQCRRRHRQRGEAGRRVRSSSKAARPWWRSCCSSTTSTAWD